MPNASGQPDSNKIKLAGANKVLSRQTYPAGKVIFRQGENADRAFIVLNGEVAISVTNKNGQDIHLTTLKKGQVFGEMALMMNAPRSASAVAQTACELTVISKKQLDDKMVHLDPLVRRWVETLAKRIVAASNRAE